MLGRRRARGLAQAAAPARGGGAITRVVDALAAIRSSRFDLPLTYDAGELDLTVGDVVRVPLGSRDVVAFVVSPVRDEAVAERPLKPVAERLPVPRAFDEIGLQLAQFIADRYLCTLGEALTAVVLADAVPRMRDSFERAPQQPDDARYPSVPPRMLALVWNELDDGFELERLLRHPEARRIGDRATLLQHVSRLVRGGDLRRHRRLQEPRTHEYRVKTLFATGGSVTGKKARALVEFVAQGPDGVPRADALLAGFSSAIVARAVKAGALIERDVAPPAEIRTPPAPAAFTPTAAQRAALQRIEAALQRRAFEELLLYGVTGSGKTFVYVEAIARVLREGGRAIVLVPEISLTPQISRRFEAAFGNRVAVLHSALSQRERFDAWQACRNGDIDVVVGARSAVFAPLKNVRLLVVDEAHEATYKQDSVPRYRTTAVARERMRLEGGVLVLGSATPSVESYAAALAGDIGLLQLPSRATDVPMPIVEIIDLAKEFEAGDRRLFATALTRSIGQRLQAREKCVLFVNRRGSARFVLCRGCGHVPQCPRCSVSLSAHRSEGLLRCHYCDYQAPLAANCAACGRDAVAEYGFGTEAVADEVQRLFPQARVLRMDSDTTTRVGDHARILTDFERDGDVLVGTQMVAKGLDFPAVTLAAVVAADVGLHAADFRAAERSFALIAQLCGRSGRAGPGDAIVQTYAPAHPAIVFAARHDYAGFASRELEERRDAGFPPALRLIYLGVIARTRTAAFSTAQRYAELLRGFPATEVLGPAPYPIARLNGEWRYRIALKTSRSAALRAAIRDRIVPLARADRATRLAINVDP